jgi:hypothetical protein
MLRYVVLLLTFLLFFQLVTILQGYVMDPGIFIATDRIKRNLGDVKVCPDRELFEETKLAAHKWNSAIEYFAVRFMWFELNKLKLIITDKDCDVFISLGKPYEKRVGNVRFLDENILATAIPGIEGGKIIFNITVSDRLPRSMLLPIIIHELSHVLGLGHSITKVDHIYKPATDASGSGSITSYDVYALYVKYVKNGDEQLVRIPAYIPYMTADMPLPDIVSAGVSAVAAFMIARKLRGRKNK